MAPQLLLPNQGLISLQVKKRVDPESFQLLLWQKLWTGQTSQSRTITIHKAPEQCSKPKRDTLFPNTNFHNSCSLFLSNHSFWPWPQRTSLPPAPQQHSSLNSKQTCLNLPPPEILLIWASRPSTSSAHPIPSQVESLSALYCPSARLRIFWASPGAFKRSPAPLQLCSLISLLPSSCSAFWLRVSFMSFTAHRVFMTI